MKIREFEQRLREELISLDHDEITSVETRIDHHRPNDHTLMKVKYASTAASVIMVQSARGPGIPKHEFYQLPKEAF